MGKSKVYTPQVVVNGVVEGIGNTDRGLKHVIKRGQNARKGEEWVKLEPLDNGVKVIGSVDRKGRVVVITYNTRMVEVDIRTGENAGKRLPFVNVVKDVVDLGEWIGGEQAFDLERTLPGETLAKVVLVQEGKGGPIVGIVRV